jgi:hypothetical protein
MWQNISEDSSLLVGTIRVGEVLKKPVTCTINDIYVNIFTKYRMTFSTDPINVHKGSNYTKKNEDEICELIKSTNSTQLKSKM